MTRDQVVAHFDVSNQNVIVVSSVAYRNFEIVPRGLTDDV